MNTIRPKGAHNVTIRRLNNLQVLHSETQTLAILARYEHGSSMQYIQSCNTDAMTWQQ